MRKVIALIGLVSVFSFAVGCKGVRTADDKTFVAHAEAFRIIGIALPSDDMAAALSEVPQGATITSVHASPSDWTSVLGILNNIIGFTATRIGGELKK